MHIKCGKLHLPHFMCIPLIYHFAVEGADTQNEEKDEGHAQTQGHPAHRQRGKWLAVKSRHHRVAQTLRGVGHEIEQRDDLELPDIVQRTPGIVCNGCAGCGCHTHAIILVDLRAQDTPV